MPIMRFHSSEGGFETSMAELLETPAGECLERLCGDNGMQTIYPAGFYGDITPPCLEITQ